MRRGISHSVVLWCVSMLCMQMCLIRMQLIDLFVDSVFSPGFMRTYLHVSMRQASRESMRKWLRRVTTVDNSVAVHTVSV